jgi:hypothetical protein
VAQGWAYEDRGPIPGAYVTPEFTRTAVDGLLVVEEYRERGYGSTDRYILVRPQP